MISNSFQPAGDRWTDYMATASKWLKVCSLLVDTVQMARKILQS